MLSIRVISIDSYQAIPIPNIDPIFSNFRGSDIKQVPVLRIFGITLEGEKACLHIHGVFPYLYVPYTGQTSADVLTYHLASSIDTALNVSLGLAKAKNQHVYKIIQVSGIPFYGYHKQKHHFFKVYFYNPNMIKQAAILLQSGSVLGQSLQPYESHIPFTQQFMIDYNIYGMSLINLKNAMYRYSAEEIHNSVLRKAINNPTNYTEQYLPFTVTKKSICKIEIDALASDILNREEIERGLDLNPGISAIWEEEKARRACLNINSVSHITYSNSPERPETAYLQKDSDLYFETKLTHRLGLLESQVDDDLIHKKIENLSYPVAIPDNCNLTNASMIEVHADSTEFSVLHKQLTPINDNLNNQSMNSHQNSISKNSPLDVSDINVVEMLANLATDQKGIRNSIDANSILGTQNFQENNDNDNGENEEEDTSDLNITNLELDTLNINSWETMKETLHSTSHTIIECNIEPKFKTSNEFKSNESVDKISQVHGPAENKNLPLSETTDLGITEQDEESVSCNTKVDTEKNCHSNVPPKRKCSSKTEEDFSDEKRKKDLYYKFSKMPSQTSHRLTSSHSELQTYSSLNLKIIKNQKTTIQLHGSCKRAISENKIFLSESVKKLEFEKACLSTNSELNDKKNHEKSNKNKDKILKTTAAPAKFNFIKSNKYLKKIFNQNQESGLYNHIFLRNASAVISGAFIHKNKIVTDNNTTNCKQSFIKTKSHLITVITPKFQSPLKRDLIKTLESYYIPKCNYTQPFYSDPEDDDRLIRNSINFPLYQTCSKSLENLSSFKSFLDNVLSFEHLRQMMGSKFGIASTCLSWPILMKKLFANETIVIIPIKKTPSLKSIKIWVRGWKEHRKIKRSKNQVLSGLKEKGLFGPESLQTDTKKSNKSVKNSEIFNSPDLDDESKHIGVSCGQIEFTSNSNKENISEKNLAVKMFTQHQFLTIFSAEVHVLTRSELLPDPRFDPVSSIFYAVYNDVPSDWSKKRALDCGAVIVDEKQSELKLYKINNKYSMKHNLIYVAREEDLFETFVKIIDDHDPEIFIGWDLEFLSWGYIFQRAKIIGKGLYQDISRVRASKYDWKAEPQKSYFGTLSEIRLPGRIVLDLWRILKYEIALMSYTYENVVYHVLNERVPHHDYHLLTKWWKLPHFQWKVIDYFSSKVLGIHRLLKHLDIINRTSEHARLYGIQFFEVFCRGSQFRVESMMLRLAKPLNYIPVSPTPQQRARMRAPESLPLIMEPESTMYCDPVVVLDFQSLYPSIIIAYNYCFSTCLGRVSHIGSSIPFEFGCTNLKVPKNLIIELKNHLNYAPCGVAFVKKELRRGIIPRMLEEILRTRLMVKKAIKDHPKEDRSLQRALHSRQLGLKLIANVTYGYTAANFSGRMPCIEVGDSVVSKGKETLERAIQTVESNSDWRARVIYGDTDSLFVLLKGRTREDAFKIGTEIADQITAENPKPVKLKFEKILQPCILQTKKRYCGYMYENLNDKPIYLAKGIETVRRDGCAAVSKILEKSLRILFDTKDVTKVKHYVLRQLDKIMTGKVSYHDLIFAREFRGMKGYKPTACVPSLELTRRLMQKDPRAIPRTGARVPYIIVSGPPNVPLICCVKSPMELIRDVTLKPNAIYYITKCILPPLNRCLKIIGVDAMIWFMNMPHNQNYIQAQETLILSNKKLKTIFQYISSHAACFACGNPCDNRICKTCLQNFYHTFIALHEKSRQSERIFSSIKKVCESCIGIFDMDSCSSLDCPIFYRRIQLQQVNTELLPLHDLIQKL